MPRQVDSKKSTDRSREGSVPYLFIPPVGTNLAINSYFRADPSSADQIVGQPRPPSGTTSTISPFVQSTSGTSTHRPLFAAAFAPSTELPPSDPVMTAAQIRASLMSPGAFSALPTRETSRPPRRPAPQQPRRAQTPPARPPQPRSEATQTSPRRPMSAESRATPELVPPTPMASAPSSVPPVAAAGAAPIPPSQPTSVSRPLFGPRNPHTAGRTPLRSTSLPPPTASARIGTPQGSSATAASTPRQPTSAAPTIPERTDSPQRPAPPATPDRTDPPQRPTPPATPERTDSPQRPAPPATLASPRETGGQAIAPTPSSRHFAAGTEEAAAATTTPTARPAIVVEAPVVGRYQRDLDMHFAIQFLGGVSPALTPNVMKMLTMNFHSVFYRDGGISAKGGLPGGPFNPVSKFIRSSHIGYYSFQWLTFHKAGFCMSEFTWSIIQYGAIVGTGSAVGASIGAIVGSYAGGVGTAPGAAAGAQVGAVAGTVIGGIVFVGDIAYERSMRIYHNYVANHLNQTKVNEELRVFILRGAFPTVLKYLQAHSYRQLMRFCFWGGILIKNRMSYEKQFTLPYGDPRRYEAFRKNPNFHITKLLRILYAQRKHSESKFKKFLKDYFFPTFELVCNRLELHQKLLFERYAAEGEDQKVTIKKFEAAVAQAVAAANLTTMPYAATVGADFVKEYLTTRRYPEPFGPFDEPPTASASRHESADRTDPIARERSDGAGTAATDRSRSIRTTRSPVHADSSDERVADEVGRRGRSRASAAGGAGGSSSSTAARAHSESAGERERHVRFSEPAERRERSHSRRAIRLEDVAMPDSPRGYTHVLPTLDPDSEDFAEIARSRSPPPTALQRLQRFSRFGPRARMGDSLEEASEVRPFVRTDPAPPSPPAPKDDEEEIPEDRPLLRTKLTKQRVTEHLSPLRDEAQLRLGGRVIPTPKLRTHVPSALDWGADDIHRAIESKTDTIRGIGDAETLIGGLRKFAGRFLADEDTLDIRRLLRHELLLFYPIPDALRPSNFLVLFRPMLRVWDIFSKLKNKYRSHDYGKLLDEFDEFFHLVIINKYDPEKRAEVQHLELMFVQPDGSLCFFHQIQDQKIKNKIIDRFNCANSYPKILQTMYRGCVDDLDKLCDAMLAQEKTISLLMFNKELLPSLFLENCLAMFRIVNRMYYIRAFVEFYEQQGEINRRFIIPEMEHVTRVLTQMFDSPGSHHRRKPDDDANSESTIQLLNQLRCELARQVDPD